MSAIFITGKELFELEPQGFGINRAERIERRIAVKRVWCALVKYNHRKRLWTPDTALSVKLKLSEINIALKQGSTGLWGDLQDWELNAFGATLKDWKKRNTRSRQR